MKKNNKHSSSQPAPQPSAPDPVPRTAVAEAGTVEGGPGIERLLDTWVNLEKELAERNAELGRLRLEAAAAEERLRDAREEVASVGTERDRLRGEAQNHATQLAEQRRRIALQSSQVTAFQAELAVARRALDEAAATGEGNSRRRGAEKRLTDYRDALLGLEHTLEERDRAIGQHGAEMATLADRIADLERQLAEITGRWRESEAANARLQSMLADAVRGAERIEGDLRQARDGADHVARQLAEKTALIATLQAVDSRRQAAGSSGQAESRKLGKDLAEERKRVAGLLADLRDRDHRLAQSQDEITAIRQDLAAARASVGDTAGSREALVEQLTQRDAATAGMQERLDAVAAERDRLAAELDRQREAARELTTELRRQTRTNGVLGREIERLKGLEAEVRKLDGLMNRHAAGAPAAQARRQSRLVVSLEGEHRIKYPLYKPSMIIGRAGDADIHVIGRHTSRRHARIILLDDDTAVIEDLGSLNGVRVNDRAVTRQPLHDGDLLDVGGARLQFVDLAERQPARNSA